MKILVIGKNGQVGSELAKGNVIGVDRSALDLEKSETIIPFIDSIKPNIIINAAAYTAVDAAETEQELAYAINERAPYEIAKAAKKNDALFIHFSTDYVFNGQKLGPYEETDVPDPLNVYGKSKLKGEQAVESIGGRFIIFRTSWVYSPRGKNFLLTMLKLAQKDELKIVNDQFGAPTCSLHIAKAVSSIIGKDVENGIYNLTASGVTSWHGFAEEIFSHYKVKPTLIGIPSSEYSSPAKRPQNSVLSHKKLNEKLNIVMPDWKEGILHCLS